MILLAFEPTESWRFLCLSISSKTLNGIMMSLSLKARSEELSHKCSFLTNK
jgi:hypothetical protein